MDKQLETKLMELCLLAVEKGISAEEMVNYIEEHSADTTTNNDINI